MSYPPVQTMAAPAYGVPVEGGYGAGPALDALQKFEQLVGNVDSLLIRQKAHLLEAVTQGCVERRNEYNIFDAANPQVPILYVQEHSECWDRMCCAPQNSLVLTVHARDKFGEVLLTIEREGCNCCKCTKCTNCFACNDRCRDQFTVHVGDVGAQPGVLLPANAPSQLGYARQPKGGGGFKPTIQVMDRGDPKATEAAPSATATGPCITGGCSEACVTSVFPVLNSSHEQLATIRKLRPRTCGDMIKECCTDADNFEVAFRKGTSAREKALQFATVFMLDFQLFELDNGMCKCKDGGLYITLCNIYCYGCLCPCVCVLKGNDG
ncbi:unnamed protein product [Pedinophyceae sp. YPF-701]|nr:unnamed protein product [Pedinophyceae sp. YPF-701]